MSKSGNIGSLALVGILGYAVYAIMKKSGSGSSGNTASATAASAALKAQGVAAAQQISNINKAIANVPAAAVGTHGYEYNDWLIFTAEGRAAMTAYETGGANPLIAYNAAVKANLEGRK